MSRVSTAVVLTIALTGLAGCGIHAGENSFSFSLGREAESTFEWSGQVADGQWLEIKGINGELNAMPSDGSTIQVTAIRSGFRSDPNEVEIVVVEHADGVTICAVYPTSGDQPNECAPGNGGRNSTRNNDVKVTFDVLVPAGVRFAGRMVNASIPSRRPRRRHPCADGQRQCPAVDLAGRLGQDGERVDQGLLRWNIPGRRGHLRDSQRQRHGGGTRDDQRRRGDPDIEWPDYVERAGRHDASEPAPGGGYAWRGRPRPAAEDGQRQHHPRTHRVGQELRWRVRLAPA